jgi:hypothetical protein
MQKVEDKKHEPGRVAGVRRGLDHAEGRDAVGEDATELAVEIGLARAERRHGRGDGRIFIGPVEPGAGQRPDGAVIEARMHAVAVELDFVQPIRPVGRFLHEFGQLLRDPFRRTRRIGARRARRPPRRIVSGSAFTRQRMRLFEMIDLADMSGGMGELEPDTLAMPAGRKAPALDHRHLVRHVHMRGIVGDRVDAGLRHNLARLEFLRHGWPP